MDKITIFISYSREDNDFIKKLSIELKKIKNVEVWIDENLRAGSKFNKRIYEALQKADIIIFVISKNLIEREYSYVKDIELPLALLENRKRGAFLVPLIINQDSYNSIFFNILKKDFISIPEYLGKLTAIDKLPKKKWWDFLILKKEINPYLVLKENIKEQLLGKDFQDYLKKKNSKNRNDTPTIYIKRDIETRLNYWFDSDSSACYIVGAEGYGKTFLAKSFIKEKEISFFLKSIEWKDCKDINDILLKSFGFYSKEEIKDINYFLNGFEHPILIVLDGVNEKGALVNIEEIFNDYFESKDNELFQSKIKLLFTTRDLEEYSGFIKTTWNKLKRIDINRYNDREFNDALSSLDNYYDINSFPKNILDLAKIPKYLKLAFKLKDKFEGIENIKKEMLYWENLKDIIINDLKVKDQLNLNSTNIERVLFKLVSNSSIENNKIVIDDNKIEDVFKKSLFEIETLLKELNFIDSIKINGDIELKPNHIVIGYSFYLISKFQDIDTSKTIIEIADKIKSFIEPYDSDFISLIPYITFQLSLEKKTNQDLSKIHASLLYLWFDNHNSDIYSNHLEFWCKKDFESFVILLDFIDFEKNNLHYVKLVDYLTNIIAKVWKESSTESNINEIIEKYIKDNILNIINIKDSIQKRKFYRVIKILYFKPQKSFLCLLEKYFSNLQEIEGTNLKVAFVSLLRFAYKENYFNYLIEKQYTNISKLYCSHSLYEELSMNMMSIPYDNLRGVETYKKAQEIKKNHDVLKGFTVEGSFSYSLEALSLVSSRKDIELSLNDSKIVKSFFSKALEEDIYTKYIKNSMGNQTSADDIYKFFPSILSSIDIKFFNKKMSDAIFMLIKNKSYFGVNDFKYTLLVKSEVVNYILENLDYLYENNKGFNSHNNSFQNLLIEVMLFNANKKQLKQFFEYLIKKKKFKSFLINNQPVDYYVKSLFSKELKQIVDKKLEKDKNNHDKELLMIYLYVLRDYSNIKYIEYIKENIFLNINKRGTKKETSTNLLENSEIEKDNKFELVDKGLNDGLINKLINIPPKIYFEKIYFDEKIKFAFKSSLGEHEGWKVGLWITREKDFYNEKSFKELVEILPIDSVGVLLEFNNRESDLNEWGEYIFEKLSVDKLNKLNVGKSLEKYAKANTKDFESFALRYLEETSIKSSAFYRSSFENEVINLLVSIDFDKSLCYYKKLNENKTINDSFIIEVFKCNKNYTKKHKKFRKEYIKNLENDMEALIIVRIMLETNGIDELKNIINELLQSEYSSDRLLAISLLPWVGDSYSIKELDKLINSDDSEYVRVHASWGQPIAYQEMYSKEIYEEIIKEEDLEVISAKLYQIKPILSKMVNYWGIQLNEKYDLYSKNTPIKKVILIQRFWNMISEDIKDDKKYKANMRVLSEYYRGEKINYSNEFITKNII